VLAHLVPQADVPVVQLALDGRLSPRAHLELAERLAPLRDEGVLILGSGNVVHNLRRMQPYPGAPAFVWAERFEEYVCAAASACDAAPLIAYENAGTDADASVPTPEHYLPFLYAFGAGGRVPKTIVRGIEAGSISMLSMQFA
jgi:4,5-DOPA dioxygenase extradiol